MTIKKQMYWLLIAAAFYLLPRPNIINITFRKKKQLTIEKVHDVIIKNKLDEHNQPRDAFAKALCVLTKQYLDFQDQHHQLEYLYARYEQKYCKNRVPLYNYYMMKI